MTKDELARLRDERDEYQHKLECLLSHVTGGRASKASYGLETMYELADEQLEREIEAKDKLIAELVGALESIANQDSPLSWGDVMSADARKALAKAKELG